MRDPLTAQVHQSWEQKSQTWWLHYTHKIIVILLFCGFVLCSRVALILYLTFKLGARSLTLTSCAWTPCFWSMWKWMRELTDRSATKKRASNTSYWNQNLQSSSDCYLIHRFDYHTWWFICIHASDFGIIDHESWALVYFLHDAAWLNCLLFVLHSLNVLQWQWPEHWPERGVHHGSSSCLTCSATLGCQLLHSWLECFKLSG